MKPLAPGLRITIATITLLLLPSCASRNAAPDPASVEQQMARDRTEELELVRSTVSDPERADRLIALLGERDRLVSEAAKDVSEYRAELAALNADYDATRESFDQLVAGYNERRRLAQTELVDLISAMKGETTTQEWKVISKYQLKRMNPRALAYTQPSGGV